MMRPRLQQLDAVALYDGVAPPERLLWLRVIAQAVADATDGPVMAGGQIIDDAGRRVDPRQDARDWILVADDNFLAVCDLAGVNPDLVRRAIQ